MKSAEHGPALSTDPGGSCIFGYPFVGAHLHVGHRGPSNALLRLRKVGKIGPSSNDGARSRALAIGGLEGVFSCASARLTLAFAILDQIKAGRERPLVFLNDLDMQARLIQRRYRVVVPPMVINGAIAGGDRQARVDRFQAGPDEFEVMILSPQAGGVGLTLTRANHVIHLARWWNPAVEDQCTCRALRIGQEKTECVHIPMATLDDGRSPFDENLHALLERKRTLMNEALMPPEATEGDLDSLLDASVN